MPPPIRRATPTDWEAIAQLRAAVGWSVRRWTLDAFRPPVGAAWVAEVDGRVVGCGSGIVHGRIGIVGNMIVAPGHRRRGIGAAVLRQVLDFLEPRTETIELNATSDGRPLYARFGFAPVSPYLSAGLPAGIGQRSAALSVEPWTDATALAAWDEPRFGGSRRSILAAAAEDPERPILVARARDGRGSGGARIAGYAVLRPLEAAIGPFVADGSDAVAALLGAAAEREPSIAAWRITLPGDNAVAVAWLRRHGLPLEPHGMQMRLGAEPRRRIESIWGIGAGAIG
jgi:GNAT superfamily N-acetyltransferase